MSASIFAFSLSTLRLASTSASRMSWSSSWSVPSTASWRPLRRNSFSTSFMPSSSASRPSRRARSASLTIDSTSASGSVFLLSSALFTARNMPVKSLSMPPARATPKVPPKIRMSGGRRNISPMLPPSRKMSVKTEPNATTIPTMLAGSMSTLPGVQLDDVGRLSFGVYSGLVGDHVRAGGCAGRVLCEVLRVGDDGGAELPDEADHLGQRLGDDVLLAVDERDDRVGRAVGTLDEVRVQGENGAAQAGQEYHGCLPS